MNKDLMTTAEIKFLEVMDELEVTEEKRDLILLGISEHLTYAQRRNFFPFRLQELTQKW